MRGNFILYFFELVIFITSGVVLLDNKKIDLERSLAVILVAALLHGLIALGLVCGAGYRHYIMAGLSAVLAIIAAVALGLVYSKDDNDDEPLSMGLRYAVLVGAILLPLFNVILVGSKDSLFCKSSSECAKGEKQQVKNAVRDYVAFKEDLTNISNLGRIINVEDELKKYPELIGLQGQSTEIIGDDVGLNCARFAKKIKETLLKEKQGKHVAKLAGQQQQLQQRLGAIRGKAAEQQVAAAGLRHRDVQAGIDQGL